VFLTACRIGFDPQANPTEAVDASEPDAGDVDALVASCGTSYVPLPNVSGAYRVISTQARWVDAEAVCEADNAHLVVVNSSQEDAAVRANVIGNVWIGASDRITEGTFVVVTGGGTIYSNWQVNIPSNVAEDCVHLRGDGFWEDGDCNVSFASICECDGLPAVAGAF